MVPDKTSVRSDEGRRGRRGGEGATWNQQRGCVARGWETDLPAAVQIGLSGLARTNPLEQWLLTWKALLSPEPRGLQDLHLLPPDFARIPCAGYLLVQGTRDLRSPRCRRLCLARPGPPAVPLLLGVSSYHLEGTRRSTHTPGHCVCVCPACVCVPSTTKAPHVYLQRQRTSRPSLRVQVPPRCCKWGGQSQTPATRSNATLSCTPEQWGKFSSISGKSS